MNGALRRAHIPGHLPALTGLFVVGLIVHRLGRRSGASGEEVRAPLPAGGPRPPRC